jgi:hypothetical protein
MTSPLASSVRRPLLAVGLLGILALAGCGGGAEEPGSRPASAGTTASQSSTAAASASTGATAPTATAPNGVTSATAGTTTPTTGAPAKASTGAVAEAEAICARRNHELENVPIGAGGISATASAASRQAAIEQRALAELGKLTPPADKARGWGQVITQSKNSLDDVVKLAKAAGASESAGVTRQLARLKSPGLRLLVAGAHAGLRKCAVIG